MRLFVSLIVLSAVLHFLAIYFVPSLGYFKKNSDDEKAVFIVVQQIEIPKPIPEVSKKTVNTDRQATSAKTVTEPINTPKDYTPSFIPSGMETPMILPDIQLPESLTEAVPEIVIPDISGINESESISSLEGVSVKQELASVETARPNSDKNENPFDNKSEKASKVLSEGQIYNFDILPSNNRKLSYIPPEPEFALENDAKVTLKFSIDRNGNTSDIIFVTRNDGRVEALAYDYIRRMRFEAVLHDAKDTAQITLTFKVIK